MKPRELLEDWLKDAYAMEKSGLDILDRQLSRTKDWPEIHAKINEHRKTTKNQAKRIAGCLERLDSAPSKVKEGVGRFMGNAQAFANALSGDEVIKNTIADFTFEQFEIASYEALVAAADRAGEPEIKKVCQEILREERAMATWLEAKIPEVVTSFMEREASAAAE